MTACVGQSEEGATQYLTEVSTEFSLKDWVGLLARASWMESTPLVSDKCRRR